MTGVGETGETEAAFSLQAVNFIEYRLIFLERQLAGMVVIKFGE
jgi:hypothetical protein